MLIEYWKRGERANLTPEELIDFLGVSADSVLEQEGYTDEESDAVMQISDQLTAEELQG